MLNQSMGYHVQDIVSWYQKKIGTYDKQQWEKTVEQRILSGFTHVPMKSAKLKTELIDVDLVRGSAFTKAKPKHGFLTVTRLAALRVFFMPFYYQWWICQTSSRIFIALIVLYSLQLFNTFLYFTSCYLIDTYNTLENIPSSEVLVPFAMMLVLSIIHSQIVSTHPSNGRNKKEEALNHFYARRLKRTRRRNASASKIRSTHPDVKELSEGNVESSNSLSDTSKCNQRIRIKKSGDKSFEKSGRTVMWKTTPVKNKQRYREILKRDEGGIASENLCCLSTSTSQNDIDQSERIPTECTEEQVQLPTMDDDGFESLDGNGSSDSNKEEQDMSLTAAEFETALKNSPVRGDSSYENGLVILKCCPKFSKQNDNVSSHDHCKNDGDRANSLEKLVTPEDCLEVSFADDENVEYAQNKDDAFAVNCPDGSHGLPAGTLEQQTSPRDVCEPDGETDIDGSASEVSESTSQTSLHSKKKLLTRRRGSQQNLAVSINKNLGESSYNSSGDESEDGATLSSPCSFCPLTEGTTSAGEWVGVTTNSEECSYSSELDGSDNQFAVTSDISEHPFAWEMEMMPNVIFSPSCAPVGKVSCTMWEKRDVKKANLSVLDISSAIIARVEAMPENVDYFYIGIVMSVLLATIPCVCRLTDTLYDNSNKTGNTYFGSVSVKNYVEPYCPVKTYFSSVNFIILLLNTAFGSTLREYIIITIAMLERFCLAAIFFFLLTVAERTFKQRFLYAKFFSHLTSFRRAKKSELPHFRLNKVRNIKSWLSVRSYLKKRGPQRSVDVIVSTSFLITVILLSFLSVELLKDSEYNVEAVGWCVVIGFFMLRFMTLGTKINRKYRNLSTLITEQINLYLQIEQKPNKKEELMVANSVLKLAADLLKELESPFKISGFSANPYLYTVTKVVMLSALSGILSEFLGFKLKLHKIKIK